jgi:hypothetical protein
MSINVNIGSLIYGKLHSVASTYPLVAENTTKFPFIIYKTNATRPELSKDGIYDWIYTVQVNVVDDKYDTVCDLCNQALDKLMELEEVLDINITDISEDFIDDAYVKTILIQIKK